MTTNNHKLAIIMENGVGKKMFSFFTNIKKYGRRLV